jgi:erythromycin esterase-like protein
VPNSPVDLINKKAETLIGTPDDFNSVLDLIGDGRFVLIGEASHGTHEFYRIRAQISKVLIAQRGFNAVAVEADWPDAYRVNRFVRGASKDSDSVEALSGFQRFPQWMWRNADVLDFVGWLREHNDQSRNAESEDLKCGFYGLDLYSLHASIEGVLAYLDKLDPEAAKHARHYYSCFEHFGKDITTYGYAAGFRMAPSCEDAVVKNLVELRRKAMEYLQRDGQVAADAYFCAEQNALVVRNAEEYYRNMFRRDVSSWNLRDTHMMESLVRLTNHLSNNRPPAKIIVWAHNSHLGDARATQMSERGELNLGQLVREHFGKEAVSIGFTTFDGTVTAASDWDGPAERKIVRPAHPDSYEALFHEVAKPAFGGQLLPRRRATPNDMATGSSWATQPVQGTGCPSDAQRVDIPNFFLNLRDAGTAAALGSERLERAIGVIYRPETELVSHYFHARLPDQFDAILHYDHTRAVEPLERTAEWETGEVEETFPSGL